jgi:hypothetical protein
MSATLARSLAISKQSLAFCPNSPALFVSCVKRTAMNYTSLATLLITATAAAGEPQAKEVAPAASWKDHTISPVANPGYFENPIILNELRPVFVYQGIQDSFATGGGEAYSTGIQVRLALTERLQLALSKGGYLWINPTLGAKAEGFGDIVGSLKYALYDSEEDQFILTPGVGFQFPSGRSEVFQGSGDGVLNLFASAMKGYGNFHLTGYAGYQLAMDQAANSSQFQLNLQADYWVHDLFIPFVAFSSWTVTKAGSALPFDAEGYDTANFGASASEGNTQATLAVGFRSRVAANVDLGLAYQRAILSPEGFFDDRVTFDISYRW